MISGRRAILLAGIFWSMNGVFIKSFDLPGLTIAFYRSFFAGLVFLPWLFSREGTALAPPAHFPLSPRAAKWAAAFMYAAVVSSFVVANKMTTSANAIVLQYTAPIYVSVWAVWWLKERFEAIHAWSLALVLAGIAVIMWGGHGTPDMAGIVLAIVSGVFFSWYMVCQRAIPQESPRHVVALFNAVAVGLMLPFMGGAWHLTGPQLAGLVTMGLIQLALPYWLFVKGMQTVTAQEASLITLVEPVLNPLWVWWVIGEIPSRSTLVGGGCILAALAIRYLPGRGRKG